MLEEGIKADRATDVSKACSMDDAASCAPSKA